LGKPHTGRAERAVDILGYTEGAMTTLNYSNITCPVSMQVIAQCDCQNCVIARMDSEFEKWESDREFTFAVRVALGSLTLLVAAGLWWLAQR
jgi:hypothetical protein